jgi:hypothetical protein
MGDTVLLIVTGKRACGTGTLVLRDGVWYGRWRTQDGR